ncbi:MAG: nickel-dependent lactate racemase [Bacillota bacterium]
MRPKWWIYPRDQAGVPDPRGAVLDALRHPIGTPTLDKMCKPGSKVVILVDDGTRPTPQRLLLPVLLDELNAAGVRDKDVTIIVGLGAHRPMTGAEMRARFGDEVVARVGAVLNHDCRDEACIQMGFTESGTPISVNPRFMEADFKIAVGCIVPHIYAGWGGGAKMVQPGISSTATTTAVHRLANIHLHGILGTTDNIVRKEMEEIARRVELNFIVNCLVNRAGELVKVVAGDVVEAHREGVRAGEGMYCWRGLEPTDIVVAFTPACARDMWQSTKSLVVATRGAKQGGTVILVAPCPEGVAPGHPILAQLGSKSFDEVLAMVDAKLVEDTVGALTYMTIARCKEKCRIVIVSENLSPADLAGIGLEHASSLEEALREGMARYPGTPSVGVIEEAGELAII